MMKQKEKVMSDPILLKTGDRRVLINREPPKVDCRIVAEDYYQKMQSENERIKEAYKEAKEMIDNVWYWETCPKEYQRRIEQLPKLNSFNYNQPNKL